MILLIKLSCFLLVLAVGSVRSKNNVLKNAAPLTESMGQEVIEIAGPGAKGLPPDMDEEPSAENEDETEVKSTPVLQPVTKRSDRRQNPNDISAKVKVKAAVKIDEDDARIEKELSDIYKDNAIDYKTDNEEVTKLRTVKTEPTVVTTTEKLTTVTENLTTVAENLTTVTENLTTVAEKLTTVTENPTTVAGNAKAMKLIERSRNKNFVFQPVNLDSKAAVEIFRTSVDEISCNKKQLTGKYSGYAETTLPGDDKTKMPGAATSLKIDNSINALIVGYFVYVILKI